MLGRLTSAETSETLALGMLTPPERDTSCADMSASRRIRGLDDGKDHAASAERGYVPANPGYRKCVVGRT